jgi:hypothetical protein
LRQTADSCQLFRSRCRKHQRRCPKLRNNIQDLLKPVDPVTYHADCHACGLFDLFFFHGFVANLANLDVHVVFAAAAWHAQHFVGAGDEFGQELLNALQS